MKFIYSLSLIYLFAWSNPEKSLLTLNFTGLQSSDGQVLVKIVNEKDEKISGHKIKVKNKKASISLEIPRGTYAISAFHDANSDNILNTNAVGLPTETYGFSNNVRGWFGPPDIEDQLVAIDKNSTLNISLK